MGPTAHVQKQLLDAFGMVPTAGQKKFFESFSAFISRVSPGEVFILKGYAGTGKTSLMRTLTKVLPGLKRKVVLLAPTGRAAKVLALRTGKPAYTLHKALYVPKMQGGRVSFTLRENKSSYTVYVVDEASMVGLAQTAEASFEGRNLLEDLLEYVHSGVGCKLLLIGDPAQLPPVGTEVSPALDADVIQGLTFEPPTTHELTEVVRQEAGSQILLNATTIRSLQEDASVQTPKFSVGKEVIRLVDSYEVEDALQAAYGRHGRDQVALIVRSNKRANLYNREIRRRILGLENELAPGDLVMVVRNNYHWLGNKSKAGFLANGEVAEVQQLRKQQELHGFRFAEATLRLVDYPEMDAIDCVVMLNVLDHEGPSLPYADAKRLYDSVRQDYAHLSGFRHFEAVRNDPYLNALQLKFAYAVTCHKAQGGQWNQIFIEQAWLPNGEVDLDYLRWLYTAFTRAVDRVYLLGFPDAYFKEQ